ncbi:XkdX family protein [Listeria booriae]|uniref:XkdX family protein n=1 Tax=Listeria booriae TaxID=1552123 RepID=A0A841XN46_9LIST|nr:XkdX family protein [Listeria booriae]MBC1230560.1 XkdX family protein [Listeria booriae]MBC1233619.1 XkdX family protein [Listeria booriae]MBC1316584.1 XkdX family protein [Listeria booriae]MBC2369384.1 XkdX family protein [Listeria booriae]
MDWKAKVQGFYINGNYNEVDVQKFVTLKKITQKEADEIIASKISKDESSAE